MGFIDKWLLGGTASVVKDVADVVDKFIETPDEKAAMKLVMARMAQEPAKAQIEINKIGAAHRNVFVAGWRPFIGWVCGLGLMFAFIMNPVYQWKTGSPGPELPLDIMMELVLGMLGLAGLRTIEKLSGRSK